MSISAAYDILPYAYPDISIHPKPSPPATDTPKPSIHDSSNRKYKQKLNYYVAHQQNTVVYNEKKATKVLIPDIKGTIIDTYAWPIFIIDKKNLYKPCQI